ncbi:MAG: phosphatase PAP2 family protein [Bacteroidota bacterium]|nr:phosphatase PAP2 family protein [Bacteroidota bacterium]
MKKQLAFYIPYIVFAVTLVVLISCNEKADLHLWLTSFYTPAGDVFFRYYTFVGDWVPYVVIAGLLFYRYGAAFFVLISQLATGLVSILIKHTWNEPRPLLYFKEHFPAIQLHQVAGEHLHSVHSFPSGHTITAFAFFLSLSFFTKRPALHFLYFVLAVLVGYSRIYLSQHFAIDVLAGSFIGVSVTMLCKYYVDKTSLKWADGSLRDVFLRKKNG